MCIVLDTNVPMRNWWQRAFVCPFWMSCLIPWDNSLLTLAQEGCADHLITGDKLDLPSLGRHRETPIVTVRQMLEKLGGSGG